MKIAIQKNPINIRGVYGEEFILVVDTKNGRLGYRDTGMIGSNHIVRIIVEHKRVSVGAKMASSFDRPTWTDPDDDPKFKFQTVFEIQSITDLATSLELKKVLIVLTKGAKRARVNKDTPEWVIDILKSVGA